jgi:hypothetical protein
MSPSSKTTSFLFYFLGLKFLSMNEFGPNNIISQAWKSEFNEPFLLGIYENLKIEKSEILFWGH